MNNDLEAWAEDRLAQAGYAVLSPSMNSLFESIEGRLAIRAAVAMHEYQAVLYAIYAGPYGDYHQAQVFA
jgi:hypothetical protein